MSQFKVTFFSAISSIEQIVTIDSSIPEIKAECEAIKQAGILVFTDAHPTITPSTITPSAITEILVQKV
jgi:hypothetical protein